MSGPAFLPQLIVGLGNPGPQYAETRHNVGFCVIDALAGRIKAAVREDRRWDSLVGSGRYAGRTVYLQKPLTYMNDSGRAVIRAVQALDLAPPEVLVVCDCIDLPVGRMRLRPGGSSAGQRGVASVARELGTELFPRLRIGIGRPPDDAVEHVLAPWTATELPVIEEVLSAAAAAVLLSLRRGIGCAMNAYNGWRATASAPEPGAES